MATPQYGIKFSTIRYWQKVGLDQYRYNGIYAQRFVFESMRGFESLPSNTVGHSIIALAAVASPEHIKAVLDGTRGRRWL